MKRFCIVYVEDSKVDAVLFLKNLNRFDASIDVCHFKDGASALDFLLDEDNELDLSECVLILDLSLPKLSGYEILKRLKSSSVGRPLRTVVISGSENPEDRNRCALLGADSYFVKPFTFEEYLKFFNGPFLEELKFVDRSWVSSYS